MQTKKQIFNPYLPSYEYIPDGEPHVFDGRLYIYGSHDRFGGNDYCMNDYVCWSAPLEDLSDFRYEGVIYKKEQHPKQYERNYYFAPDVAKGKDGRYYLYYSVAHSSVMSVAVCDTPAGQYEYLGDVHDKSGHIIGSTAGDFYQFDPGIFIDDDGRIFLYSGFCPGKLEDELGRKYVGCHMCELEDDMLTVKSGPKIIIGRDESEDRRYFEAPSMRKFHGKYYIFDHRLTNNSSFCRQGVAEQIFFDENGHIAQVEATSCGLNDGPLIGHGSYPAYIACALIDKNVYADKEEQGRLTPRITQDGEDRECEPGQYIRGIRDNCLIGYKYFCFENCKSVTLTVRGKAKGILHIKLTEDSEAVVSHLLELDSSEWQKVKIPLLLDSNKSAFYLAWQGEGAFDFIEFFFS